MFFSFETKYDLLLFPKIKNKTIFIFGRYPLSTFPSVEITLLHSPHRQNLCNITS